jgi:hypothetical protein
MTEQDTKGALEKSVEDGRRLVYIMRLDRKHTACSIQHPGCTTVDTRPPSSTLLQYWTPSVSRQGRVRGSESVPPPPADVIFRLGQGHAISYARNGT